MVGVDLEPLPGVPINGSKGVPAGAVVVFVTVAGRRLEGSGFSVLAHSGPPATIRLPPRRTQFCSVANWSLLNVLVVKLSRMIRSKLFNASATVGYVEALSS